MENREHGGRRRILISGGTSGIGLACAERLAVRGARVWVLGTSEERALEASNRIALAGFSLCDVSDEHEVASAVEEAAGALGQLDGVFVNAGIDGDGMPATEIDVDRFRRVLEVNVIGAFLVARASVPVLARPGAIVFNASVNALRPERKFLDYNASKAAVVSMAKTMALELSSDRISVTALCPGYFPTPMTAQYLAESATRAEILSGVPAGRTGELAEIAEVVDFLLGAGAAFMTGGVITLDGGASI